MTGTSWKYVAACLLLFAAAACGSNQDLAVKLPDTDPPATQKPVAYDEPAKGSGSGSNSGRGGMKTPTVDYSYTPPKKHTKPPHSDSAMWVEMPTGSGPAGSGSGVGSSYGSGGHIGAGSAPPMASESREQVLAKDSVVAVKVFFGTNRQVTPGTEMVSYDTRRGPMQYGIVTVTIPPNHEPGALESPDWKHFELSADPAKHIVIDRVGTLSRTQMLTLLQSAVSNTREKQVFIFIHGFANSFDDAARRTAQLAFDLRLQAVPVMFSWASQGKPTPTAYTTDEATSDLSIPELRTFLQDIASSSGATRIHVLAHSMGGRLLSKTIQSMPPDSTGKFSNVVLAAPDITADLFRDQIVPAMQRFTKHVTIYASANDQALALSRRVHSYKPLGSSDPTVTVVRGIDTIDITSVPGDWIGHSKFAETRAAVSDLFESLILDKTPVERGLKARNGYWVLR